MSTTVAHNPVQPEYYHTQKTLGFDCIDIASCYPFEIGNAIKYVWRHLEKPNQVQELRKALWYLNHYNNEDIIILKDNERLRDRLRALKNNNFVGMRDFWVALYIADYDYLRIIIERKITVLEAQAKGK